MASASARRRGGWQRWNRAAYRVGYAANTLRAWLGARRSSARLRPDRAPSTDARGERPVLWLAWGRIGDAALATAVTRHLRAWFERPLVVVGRREVRSLFTDHVDAFVPFAPERLAHDAAYRERLWRELDRDYDCVIGDVHLFHGGGPLWNGLIERLPARHKFVYEGYAPRALLAPLRPWPRGATVVEALAKHGPLLAGGHHVWHDMRHYAARVLEHAGRTVPTLDADTLRPRVLLGAAPAEVLRRHGLEAGSFLACQPLSRQRKKDVSAELWRRVFAAFPQQRIVLLGGAEEAGRDRLADARVLDLRGRTTLDDAAGLLRAAAAFVGPDSGLTHIAACLDRPTVCVAQSANLGTFFPYPAELGFGHLRTVRNPDFDACAGCFSACVHEPLWTTRRAGARCVREISATAVIEAVQAALAQVHIESLAPARARF